MREKGTAWSLREIKIRFILLRGWLSRAELLVIRGGFSHVGGKSIRHHMRMYNADTNIMCATRDTIEVFFDPETRKADVMPDFYREKRPAGGRFPKLRGLST